MEWGLSEQMQNEGNPGEGDRGRAIRGRVQLSRTDERKSPPGAKSNSARD